MTSPRRIIAIGLVAVLGGCSAVALSACSDDDVLGGDADEQVEISLTERDLSPGRVEVDAGEIEFVVSNDGDRLHAFAVETGDGLERTKNIKPGDSENVTVDLSRGSYRMYDPRGGYRRRGVSGTVVVTSDDRATVTERTVERTVVDEEDPDVDVDVPEVDDPEIQDPEVQSPPAQPAPPPPPPVVTKTVPAPPPPAETTP